MNLLGLPAMWASPLCSPILEDQAFEVASRKTMEDHYVVKHTASSRLSVKWFPILKPHKVHQVFDYS